MSTSSHPSSAPSGFLVTPGLWLVVLERSSPSRATSPGAGAIVLLSTAIAACHGASDRSAPLHVSDEEFWRLTTALSEPGGAFHTDNLVSNELSYASTLRQLRPSGGVYIGVGPEQNFSYVAALEAEMAFIIDLRDANRTLHLLYKALFEASADRVEFLSRLFSRQPPSRLARGVSVRDLFAAYTAAPPSAALQAATSRLIVDRLADHGWPLSADDRAEIGRVLQEFFEDGPDVHYDRARPVSDQRPSYRALMTAADQTGTRRSYLASEERFARIKDLHARNLIVPVVGDFGGGAIARVGDAIRQRGLLVSAFYGSNVEVYLTNQQMVAFCSSLSGLPWSRDAIFIDAKDAEPLTAKLANCPPDRRPFEGWRRGAGAPK
jgi:hypothetical protein